MKKILFLALGLMFVSANASFALDAKQNKTVIAEQKQCVEKKEEVKQEVKKCPCKKIFEATLGLTPEQIKLADANRAQEKKELKAVNQKIKKLRSKKPSERISKQIEDLKAQKVEIKAKHNEVFESYLTVEQKAKLKQMREDKKKGISCCHCRKNPYY